MPRSRSLCFRREKRAIADLISVQPIPITSRTDMRLYAKGGYLSSLSLFCRHGNSNFSLYGLDRFGFTPLDDAFHYNIECSCASFGIAPSGRPGRHRLATNRPQREDSYMHETFMRIAYQEAEAALADDEVPVGAVIVQGDRVIASAHNQRERLRDPTAHAEMIAITQAAESLNSWRLNNCTLYVTLEPCCMCAGAIVQARLGRVVYGASDPKAGAVHSLFQLLSDQRLNHSAEIVSGVLLEPCGQILTRFFEAKRQLGKK